MKKKPKEPIAKWLATMLKESGHKVSSPVRRKAGAKLRAEARGKFDRSDGHKGA